MHRTDHRCDRTRRRAAGRRHRRRVYRRWTRRRAARNDYGLTIAGPAAAGAGLIAFAAGAVFAASIALGAWRAHALSRSGALAAFVVGTLTFGFGGWPMTLVLLGFFIPSVALSRIGRARKKRLTDIGKGGARDAWQVLANGGVATVCAVIAGFSLMRSAVALAQVDPPPPGSGLTFIVSPAIALYSAFAGAYAAATADTWGTEIGTLLKRAPRSIMTLRPIATGLSGGVSLPGTLAEIAGAAWIACVAVLSLRLVPHVDRLVFYAPPARVALAVTVAGVAGALVDSLAGATIQELRRCPVCERTCETNPHVCGTPTVLVRGVRGFGNDMVNALATLTGAAVAFALAL